MTPPLPNTKAALRRQQARCRAEYLRQLGPARRRQVDLELLTQVCKQLPNGQVVAAFMPLPQEPLGSLEPELLLDALNAQAELYLPQVAAASSLRFGRVKGPKNLVSGAFGILEPRQTSHSAAALGALAQVILVPGVAFVPATGARLGRGGGYYDRFLATSATAQPSSTRRLGLCYPCDVLPQLPCESHDMKVDQVLVAGSS